MTLTTLTYSNIINVFSNWIKTNCNNISNYNAIHSSFKAGFTQNIRIAGNDGGGEGHYAPYLKTTIIGNQIYNVTHSIVEQELDAFINSIGLTDINQQIPESEFYIFITNMLSFLSTKVSYSVNYLTNYKYLIYCSYETNFVNINDISSGLPYNIIDVTDEHILTETLISVIYRYIRTKACQYRLSIESINVGPR